MYVCIYIYIYIYIIYIYGIQEKIHSINIFHLKVIFHFPLMEILTIWTLNYRLSWY